MVYTVELEASATSSLDLQVVDGLTASECIATKRKHYKYKHRRDLQHPQVRCQNEDLDPEPHSYCKGSKCASADYMCMYNTLPS